VATQAHPEFKSRPTNAHPLFRAFVAAALERSASSRLPVEIPATEVARSEPPLKTTELAGAKSAGR
jgi:CTP synthase